MSIKTRTRALLNLVFHREAVEAELDAEVRDFYETMVERYIAQGLPPQEARRIARLKFSPPEQVKEAVRDTRTGATLSSLMRDVNYAFRGMRKNPVFALVTILTLALGIGANSTIFSLISRFILHPPPMGDPTTLMSLHTTHDGDRCCNNFTWPLFADIREQSRSFSGLAAYYDLIPASVEGNGNPERVFGQSTTTNFFDVAQLSMSAGRGFIGDEDNLSVVVLGYRLWQRRFGGDPDIAGKTVHLSGRPFTVVGVAPPNFRSIDTILDCQFWVPLGALDRLLPNTANRTSRNYHWLSVIGRLKSNVSPAQATAELKVVAQSLAIAHPESEKAGGFLLDQAGSIPPRDKPTILVFLAALSMVALLVLCIACANVANLSLAQAAGRQREMAVRLALGATRAHLFRQLLTETMLLALAGGLLSILLSLWATRSLTSFRVPAPIPLDLTISVDWRVLLYTFVLSAGAGLLFGLAPAWAAARPVIASALKGEELLSRPGRPWNLRNVLVVAQISMSLVLLCATGLFLRSLENASRIGIGFRSSEVLMMAIDPRLHGYTPERATQFLNLVRARMAVLPDVVAAACTDIVPLSGGNRSDGFEIVGRSKPAASNQPVDLYMVTPGYFETIGIPRVEGRDFASETATSPRMAIVNQTFVRTFFGKEDPIGQHVRDGGRTYEIIGVVGDVKSRTLGEQFRPVLYRSLAQDIAADPSSTGYTVLVRYSRNPGPLVESMRREIRSLDPALAVFDVKTMEQHLHQAMFLPRLMGTLFGIFGFIGLSLATVGLYGVISYWVSRRTREIGIRLALGAQTGKVQRLIIGQGMLLAGIAIGPGLGAAWALAKLFTSFLYGVPAHDALTFIFVPLFLIAIALLACWLPSRRIASLDPSTTLRHE